MAKKKQRKKIYKIPEPKLEKIFNCPECGRKKVVEVHFNKRDNKGYLRCRACGEEYESKLKRASDPIDIYYNWINHRDNEREKNNENNQKNKEEGAEEVEEGENEEIEQQENENEEQEQSKDKGDDDEEADGDYNEEEGSDY